LSLQKNNFTRNIDVVFLCAGEGSRFLDFSKETPKSLIRIESLNNTTILEHAIDNFSAFLDGRLIIITGHLGKIIKRHVAKIVKKNKFLKEKLTLIDSGIQYKRGPLYSFLSITKNSNIYKKNKIFLVVPGDTLFNKDLLHEVFTILYKNFGHVKNSPFLFYKKIKSGTLKAYYNCDNLGKPKIISTLEFQKLEQANIIEVIKQLDLREVPVDDTLNLIIPIFIFHINFIEEIVRASKITNINTIRDVLNLLLAEGKSIFSFAINPNLEFFDIDTKSDLDLFNQKKKKSGQ